MPASSVGLSAAADHDVDKRLLLGFLRYGFGGYGGVQMPLGFRSASVEDAGQVAWLHADSWRRHYRGAYADSFLDGDVESERLAVWAERLVAPGRTATILAEDEGQLVGFVHVMFDHDPRWGSLVDNLHVYNSNRRTGIGTQLIARAAETVTEQANGDAMYLWVLQQNTSAQDFYVARGGVQVETATVPPPGGDPTRLNGSPKCLRMSWPNAAQLR
ncbi:GNAT family N-acetyltransferase [Kribbella sp. NPDC050124]|uniref:GNAT family N-acetyltransferase n=1 Tax=Kribbella sp. NPDC050124 TaxID=3364114 RepID=UPI00379C6A7C